MIFLKQRNASAPLGLGAILEQASGNVKKLIQNVIISYLQATPLPPAPLALDEWTIGCWLEARVADAYFVEFNHFARSMGLLWSLWKVIFGRSGGLGREVGG